MADKEIKKLSLKEKINACRQAMNVKKENSNNYLKYSYRNIEDLWSVLAVLESEYKLNYDIVREEIKECAGHIFVHYEAQFADLESDETLQTFMDVPLIAQTKQGLDPTQVYGGLLTYARRYIVSRDFQVRSGLADLDFDSDVQTQQRMQADEQEKQILLDEINNATSREELSRLKNTIASYNDEYLKQAFNKKWTSFKQAQQ